MRYLAVLICFFTNSCAIAQIKNGTYKSSVKSFRENLFLVIKGDSIIFYGWELNLQGDTIYYRSPVRFVKDKQLTFKKFYFSKKPVTEINISNFKPGETIWLQPFFLHRYFGEINYAEGHIRVWATKDAYDSSVDEFQFDLIK